MKVNGLTFYLLHVKLMNVSEELENYFFEHSKTVVAYLLMHNYKSDAEDQVIHYLEVQRIDRIKSVNYDI